MFIVLNSLFFQLRPGMERYQRAVVHITAKRQPSPDLRAARVCVYTSSGEEDSSSTPLSTTSTTNHTNLTCPSGTLQDPSYLTIPFTTSSPGPLSPSPKRAKEQGAFMFIAGDHERLVIGKLLICMLKCLLFIVIGRVSQRVINNLLKPE